jgi:hypothetical protein
MAADQYRARAAELLAQSRLEPDEDAAAMLEDIATCFQQLADTPAPPVVFEFPRKPVFLMCQRLRTSSAVLGSLFVAISL